MIIKIENEELTFSKFLYCTSSSISVSNNITKLNGMVGSFYKENEGSMSHRSFSLQGNFEADSLEDVERFRGAIFEKLFNKILHLYLEDNSKRYYKCVLDGQVNTSYNQGYEVGRVFTLSFTLLSFLPFAYEKEHSRIFKADDASVLESKTEKIEINYLGTVPCIANIKIVPFDNIVIYKNNTPLLKNDKTYIKVIENINLKCKGEEEKDIFTIKKGLANINNFLLVDVLDVFSLLQPLLLLPGKNEIILNKKDICYSGTERQTSMYYIEFTWIDMFY